MRALLVALLSVHAAQIVWGGTITLDFEGAPDGTPVSNLYTGFTFQNATVLTAGVSLNELEFPPHSGVNVIFDDGGPITIDFATGASEFSAFFTYLHPVLVEAFDTSGLMLASRGSLFANNLALSGNVRSSPNELISLSVPGISRVRITGDSGGGSLVLDDLTIEQSAEAVPEPGTALLFLSALAGVTLCRCRPRLPIILRFYLFLLLLPLTALS